MKLNSFKTRITFNAVKLLSTIASILVLQACTEPQTNPQLENYTQIANVQTFDSQTSYQISREYVGKIAAKQRTQLSFEYTGRVKEINVFSGNVITKGQTLASLDTELLDIKTTEIEAEIEKIDAQLTLNQANLKRIESLIENNYASEQRVDELTAERAVLTATRKGLDTSLSSLNYQISKSNLKAPYDGVVFDRLVSTGYIVNAGSPVFIVLNQNEQEIVVGIPAKLARQISVEDILPVQINDIETTAKVIAVGQQIDTSNRTIRLRLKLIEPLENVSGAIAKVSIPLTVEKAGFWIPLTALTDGIRGQWNIYLILSTESGKSNVIVPQTVNVEHTNETHAFISGVTEQQLTLVQSGLHRYVPGQVVRIKSFDKAGEQ